MPPKVVVADQKATDIEMERDLLSGLNANVVKTDATSERELIQDALDATAIIVDGYAPMSKRVLDELDQLQVIARAGIGVDNIDVDAATANGVSVVNVPDVSFGNVATHTLALLFACIRKIPLYNERVRSGSWDWKAEKPLFSLEGKTLGVVGFGSIARSLVERLEGTGVDVIGYDHSASRSELQKYGVSKVSFDELLQQADFHSIHVPLTESTEHLYDESTFERIKPGAIIVNTARGGIVDEEALYHAIDTGVISMAGLDVLSQEPPEDSPLLSLDEVIFTPHIAWYSEETITQLRQRATEEVNRVLSGNDPLNPVNTLVASS
ncbi:D-3-phosphoglycerate dehydrogenase [Halogranum rubrum]|uniref:D-3-phosphoglycerate dehydrogenase n=1 Tax=Halogranum rubrum TaxID=553466 RepID=A0A1I4JQB4_9EURY|nr:C-terminal binding protein [Halogranum rubrum]SFL68664.1 D-3-phosphoglycerate dehydrogenase [Halogranum rubrum]